MQSITIKHLIRIWILFLGRVVIYQCFLKKYNTLIKFVHYCSFIFLIIFIIYFLKIYYLCVNINIYIYFDIRIIKIVSCFSESLNDAFVW